MTTDLRDPIDDQQLEQRLRATFAAIMPLLDASPQGETSDAHERSVDTFELDDPVRGPVRNGRTIVGAIVLTAAAVATLAIVVTQREPTSTPASDSVQQTAVDPPAAPGWYGVVRPFLPDGFDQIALTHAGPEALNFKAFRTGTGQILDVSIGLRTGDLKQTNDPVTTTDQYGSWSEYTSTVVLQTVDGRLISLRCGVIPVEGGAVGDVSMAGTVRDYCGSGFDNLGIDAASRRALVERLATEFPVAAAAVDGFGAQTMAGATDDTARAAATVQQVLPRAVVAGAQGRDDLLMVEASDPAPRGTTVLSIVHGVYPPRAADANPARTLAPSADPISRFAVYDDVAVGWMVNDRGIGFQVATTDLSDANLRRLGGVLEQVALAPTPDLPVSSTNPDSTTSTTSIVETQPTLVPAYGEVMAMLPSDGWIALQVSPGPGGNLRAFDVAGRVLSFTYIESDDSVQSGCVGFDPFADECTKEINRPPVSQDDVARLANELLPQLRAGDQGALAALVSFAPVSIDQDGADGAVQSLRSELGDPAARLAVQPGVITTMQAGVPTIFEVSDGSVVASMVTADHVLLQVRTTVAASVHLNDAIRNLAQLASLGGPSAATTLLND